jgi:hypothetical protein
MGQTVLTLLLILTIAVPVILRAPLHKSVLTEYVVLVVPVDLGLQAVLADLGLQAVPVDLGLQAVPVEAVEAVDSVDSADLVVMAGVVVVSLELQCAMELVMDVLISPATLMIAVVVEECALLAIPLPVVLRHALIYLLILVIAEAVGINVLVDKAVLVDNAFVLVERASAMDIVQTPVLIL